MYETYIGSHNDYTNTVYLKACIMGNNIDRGIILLDKLNINNNGINGCSVQFITTVMQFYVSINDVDSALNLYNKYKGRKDDVMNMTIIKGYQNMERYQEGKEFIDGILKADMNVYSKELLASVMGFYVKSGDNDRSIELFDKCDGKHNDVMKLMYLKSWMNKGDMEKAGIFVDTLERGFLECCSVELISGLMHYYIGNQQYWEAIGIYDGYKCEKNDVVELLYIKGCMKLKEYSKIETLIKKMNIKDINRYCIEFVTTLIQYYSEVGDIGKCLDIWGSYRKEMDDGLRISVIKGCYYWKEFEKGIQFIESLSSNNVNEYGIEFIATLMQFYIESGNINKAMDIYNEYNREHSDTTKMLYLNCCIKGGYESEGNQLIKTLDILNINQYSIQLITMIIDFYAHDNDMKKCLELFQRINNESKITECLPAVMNGFISIGDYDDCIKLFQEHKSFQNNISILLVMKACINNNDFKIGYDLIEEFNLNKLDEYSIELLTTLVNFYGKNGDIQNMEFMYNKFDDKMDDVLNTVMINAYSNNMEFIKGKKFIKALNIQDINHHSNELMSSIIHFYGTEYQMIKAENMFKSIDEPKPVNCIASMMNVYKLNKEFEKAIQLFNTYQNICQLDEYCYSIALQCCGETASLSTGIQIIENLEQLNYNDNRKSAHIFASIISMYAKCSEFELAIKYFEDNASSFQRKDDILLMYSAAMDTYVKMGDIIQLMNKYEELKSKEIKLNDSIYFILLNGCSHSGNIPEARKIFNEYINKHNEPSFDILNGMIDCLARGNELIEAESLYDKYSHLIKHNLLKMIPLRAILSASKIHDNIDCTIRTTNKINCLNQGSVFQTLKKYNH